MRVTTDAIAAEFTRYRALLEGAIAQLDDPQLNAVASDDGNSIVTICWHIAGNLRSRFTDFLTTDGEKPWRNRDEEFDARSVTKAELLAKLAPGWDALAAALATVDDGKFGDTITIRGQPLRVDEALLRSLAHISYHVGQVVFAAKALRGREWRSLSIPRGGSAAFNAAPGTQKAAEHAAMVQARVTK